MGVIQFQEVVPLVSGVNMVNCRLFMVAQQHCNLVKYICVVSGIFTSIQMTWKIFVTHYCCGVLHIKQNISI